MANRVAPSGNVDATGAADDEDRSALEEVSDFITTIDDRFLLLLKPNQYLKMVTVVALINLLLLVIGVASDEMMTGANMQDAAASTEKATVGLWKIYYGGDKSHAVCSGWPDQLTDTPLCAAVNTSRAFFVLAAVVDLFAAICGLVRWIGGEKYHDWADEQVFSLVTSGMFGLIGYIVWMACVDKELARHLEDTVVLAAGKPVCVPAEGSWTVGNCKDGTMYYYGTLGYSYAFLSWAALFPLILLLVKVFLPRLDIKHSHEDRAIWCCGHLFESNPAKVAPLDVR